MVNQDLADWVSCVLVCRVPQEMTKASRACVKGLTAVVEAQSGRVNVFLRLIRWAIDGDSLQHQMTCTKLHGSCLLVCSSPL